MPKLTMRDRLQALKTFVFGGTSLQGGYYSEMWGQATRTLPGAQYDYRAEAGYLWENAIIAACHRWLSDTWCEVPMCVRTRDEKGIWKPTPNHPLEEWFNAPSPNYDLSQLWNGTLLWLKCTGNAYWYKLRAPSGQMTGVQPIPSTMIRPRWKDNDFITDYGYTVDGKTHSLPVEDVIHLRIGIDPSNLRLGFNAMVAVLRDICTENESATFTAALLRNKGVPGVVITPKNEEFIITPEQREKLREDWTDRFTGDQRGKPFVWSQPMDVQSFGFNPGDLLLDKIRAIPETRVCAAYGLDPMVLGFNSGQRTYANYGEAEQAAISRCLLPLQRAVGPQLDKQLLPEIVGANPTTQRIGWDYSTVAHFIESQLQLMGTLVKVSGRPILTVNEARAMLDFPPVDEGDELAQQAPAQKPVNGPEDPDNRQRPSKEDLTKYWQDMRNAL